MNAKSWQQFLKITEKLNTEELKLWFEVVLTPAEQDDIADRVCIIEALLKQEIPQRDMAAKLNVSISKITRGSNALRRMSTQKLQWLRRLVL